MIVIGITGNSGTGKSTFSKVLAQRMNAIIIDADKIAKQSAKKGEIYYNKIVEFFGEDILANEEIDRKKLATIIYNNEKQRAYLNTLTNQYVVEKIKQEIEKHKNANIIMDVPLLFESGLNNLCQVTISLLAEEETKIKRMMQRDKINEEIAIQRLKIQAKDEYYIKKSNYIIENNKANLEKEAEEFIKTKDMLNEKIVVIKNEEVKYMQISELLKYKNIEHCFTLRPMDFGDNSTYEERKNIIENNYNKLCKSLHLNAENVIRPYQTHTDNIKKVTNEKGIYPKAFENVDGLITKQREKILSLTFADCTPIYIYDKEKNVIALVHSGWVGTTKKIVKNAIEKMKQEYNSKNEDLICAIGPTIRECHFEVDEDVKDIFYETFKYMKNIEKIIKVGEKQGKFYIDTVEINKNLMKEEGILEENIIDCGVCSLCNSEIIHSYRKDGKKAGRNTAILCLR